METELSLARLHGGSGYAQCTTSITTGSTVFLRSYVLLTVSRYDYIMHLVQLGICSLLVPTTDNGRPTTRVWSVVGGRWSVSNLK
jgi:hypothetical protein